MGHRRIWPTTNTICVSVLSGVVSANLQGAGGSGLNFMKKIGMVLLVLSSLAVAQSRPVRGGHDIEIWAGGGHGVTGRTSDTGVFNAGLRYGWVLTRPHGPGFLRGNFEYAVDAVPLFLVFQPSGTAYGAAINPLNMKWDFATKGRVVPYLELSGGTLFTTEEVPLGTSKVNFTSGGAIGMHVLGSERNVSVELRYMHISNAGLTVPNPGVNTIQVRLGLGMFFHGKHAPRRGAP